ncbi:hypothetical protein B9G55_19375 [Saccharibacillus sp. O16]|nr:hypothetical protein B9G55_19375 [Saccharibacillus sp. O16]
MHMDDIHAQIRAVRLHLQWMKVGRYALRGLLAGLGGAAVLLAIARWVLVPGAWMWALACVLLGALAGAAAAYIRPVKTDEAAKAMDRADPSEERRDLMTTALEFSEQDSAAARWQRTQAEAYGREFAAARRVRLPFVWQARRFAGVGSALLVLCALLLLLPGPMDKELAQRQREQAMIEAQRKQAEKLAEQLKQAPIEPEAKAPLADSAAKLAKELGDSRRAEEALDKMEDAMKELGRKADESAQQQKALQDWSKKLAAQQLKQAAEQSGDVSKSAEALKNTLSKLSEQQKKELASAMQSLAQQAPETGKQAGALQQALQKAAQQLAESGQLSDEQIQQLAEKLAAAAAESGSLGDQSQLAAAAAAQIAKSGMSMANDLSAAGVSVSDSWGSGGSAEALASAGEAAPGSKGSGSEGSSGEGANGSPAAGQGAGQGAGSQGGGSGSGNGSGQGPGSGSGSGSGPGGSGSGQGAGAGWGSGGRELVTTPRDLKGSGNVQSDNGPSSGGGDKQAGGVSPTIDGVSRPYDEVYGEYSQRAKDSLGRSDLPQSVQGLVESYFTEIQPGS